MYILHIHLARVNNRENHFLLAAHYMFGMPLEG